MLLRLNRPEVRNAIDRAMVEALHAACAALEATPRVALLVGSGGTFAAGADIAQLRERRRDDALAGINSGVFERVRKLPMPVIALVDGYALGGGAELAYACDFRIGTPATKIGNPEPGLGILAAAGAAWRLKELVGEPLAKEMLLAGRVLDAEEALAVRLLNEVVDADDLEPAGHRPRRPHRRPGAAGRAAHQVRRGRAARRAPAGRRHRAGGAVRDPGQDGPDDGVPRPPEGEVVTADISGIPAAPSTTDVVPQAVGVYGGGRMGAGIAHAFVIAGAAVTVIENDPTSARAAHERIEASLAKAAAKGAGDAGAPRGHSPPARSRW